jgi:hypothetical protein
MFLWGLDFGVWSFVNGIFAIDTHEPLPTLAPVGVVKDVSHALVAFNRVCDAAPDHQR